MSLKRSHTSSKSAFGGGDAGAKVDRQELYDELKRMAANNETFTPVDIALSIGAGEPQVSKALLGLAAEGYLEKVETGKYKAAGMAELGQAEFLKAFARASRVDSTRQRDLSEISRLKQNNDTMRQRLLTAIAERDHYLAALKKAGIDPGPAPVPVAAPARAPRQREPGRRRPRAPRPATVLTRCPVRLACLGGSPRRDRATPADTARRPTKRTRRPTKPTPRAKAGKASRPCASR